MEGGTGVATFTDEQLRHLCDVFGDQATGLTGSEIGTLLLRLDLADLGPGATRRARILEALRRRQERDQGGLIVAAFIEAAMDPLRYAGNQLLFATRQRELNVILAEHGQELMDDGRLHALAATRSHGETAGRLAELRAELERRGAHAQVLEACRVELLERHDADLVVAAGRQLADRVRRLSGLAGDGPELVDKAFGHAASSRLPFVAFNQLRTESERAENAGLVALLKGLYGAARGAMEDDRDVVELLTLASLLHRRLDTAIRLRPVEARAAARRDSSTLEH